MPLIANTPAGMVEILSMERDIDISYGKTKADYGRATGIPREAQARVRVMDTDREIDMPLGMCSGVMLVESSPLKVRAWQYDK